MGDCQSKRGNIAAQGEHYINEQSFANCTIQSIDQQPILTVFNDYIECIHKGDMEDEHQNVILHALRYCSAHDHMNVISIRDRLEDKGMKAIVIEDDVNFPDESAATWSTWKSQKHGIFTIIMSHYDPPNDEIKCLKKGNMNNSERNMALSALSYCSAHDQMSCVNIKDRLKDYGMFSVVIQDFDGNDWAYSSISGQNMSWSTWKAGKFGRFTIIKTKFRPQENTEIICVGRGDMSTDDRDIVAQTLRYCLAHNLMKSSDICQRLNESNIQSIVIQDPFGFEYKQKSDKLTWSKWNVPAFGIYFVVIMKE